MTSAPPLTEDEYKQAMVAATNDLNIASDILTCVNLAMDNNYKTNNSYNYYSRLEDIEIQNSVEVVIDLGNNINTGSKYTDYEFNKKDETNQFRYLVLEPNKYTNRNCVYGIEGTSDTIPSKEANVKELYEISKDSKSLESVEISLYKMISELETSKNKYFLYRGKDYTIFEYYFISRYELNTDTGKIDRVIFTLKKNKNFDVIL